MVEGEAKSRSDSQVSTLLIQTTSLVCQSLDLFQFPSRHEKSTNILMQATQCLTCFSSPFPFWYPLLLSYSVHSSFVTWSPWDSSDTSSTHTTLGPLLCWFFLQCSSSKYLLGWLPLPSSCLLQSFHVTDHRFNYYCDSLHRHPNDTWSHCLFFP